MRLLALAGLMVVTIGLVPAIAVPLVLEHKHEQAVGQPAPTSQRHPGPPAVINPTSSTAADPTSSTAVNPTSSIVVNPTNPTVVASPVASLAAADVPLRMMPLGASITFGFLSSDGNGYRQDLLDLLQQGGNQDVTYVGSRNNGTMAENAVEGWPGLRIDEVLPKAQAAVPRFLPNVVLLNVGTNDCVQNFNLDNTTQTLAAQPALTADPSFDVGARLQVMIEDIYDMVPSATVVLSTLILNKDAAINARVDDANTQYRRVAADLQGQGRRLVLADMGAAAGGPNINTMADPTHPNDAGYALMANRWYAALQEASDKGLIVAPDATSA